jgi:hypothetical protein
VVGGKIYVIGGVQGGLSPTVPPVWLADVEVYDPTTDTWTTRAPMPTARMGHGAATHDGKIYAIGGWNGALLGTCEEYDPATDTWTAKSPMPTVRYMVPCATVGGLVHAIAGYNVLPGRWHEVYDPATDTWATRAPLKVGRYLHGVAVLQGRIWAVGGASSATIAGVESYDPSTDAWSIEAPLNEPRYRVAAAATATSLFALGGAPDLNNVAVEVGTNEEMPLAPPVASYCTAKAGLLCGAPAIDFTGTPSASATSGFEIRASPARSNRSGILIYTAQGRWNAPFLGGTLCLALPIRRSVAVNSGGAAATCEGVFRIDWNAFANGLLGGTPQSFLLSPGQQVNVQVWGRDSIATGSFLSNALEYTVLN